MGKHGLIGDDAAKKVGRRIAEEAWARPFMVVSDPVLRRLGASLVLQELEVRLGRLTIEDSARPYLEGELRPLVRRSRAPKPPLEGDATCRGCGETKPKQTGFYRGTNRSGIQSLCKACFSERYARRKRACSCCEDAPDTVRTLDVVLR